MSGTVEIFGKINDPTPFQVQKLKNNLKAAVVERVQAAERYAELERRNKQLEREVETLSTEIRFLKGAKRKV